MPTSKTQLVNFGYELLPAYVEMILEEIRKIICGVLFVVP